MAKILGDIFPNGLTLADLTPPAPLAPEQQLRVAMSDAGLTPPDEIILDGTLRRFSTNGKPKDASGWYVAFDDGKGPAGGAFGDWRQGLESTWRADIGRELSHVEQMAHAARMRELKAQREKEIAIIRADASENAATLWEGAPLASDEHPYLQRKGVSNPGMRVAPDGRLIAPMYSDGAIASLQYIDGDGVKRFLKGGKTGGAWWSIGGALSGKVYICEGVATAASVFEATGKPVAIAFSASNMTATAQDVRRIAGPLCELVIVADNDESGTGQREAEKAAQEVGARVWMPPVTGDANDYAQAGHDLAGELEPPKAASEGWLIPADDFSAQPAPISWLVKHWIQAQALVMVHGPSGGGKTFAVLDWCLRMAAGVEEWGGNRVKPGNVVYLAGEGHHGLRGRVAAWKHKHGVNKLNMWLSRDGCDLNTAEGYVRVNNAIKAGEISPSVIVVDTLHRFLNGDENSAQDAKTMLDACNKLMQEFGCTVVLVHHTGVSDEAQHRARGSSAWRGALDIEISIVPAKGDQPMQITQRKSKDAEIAQDVFAMLESVEIPGWIDEDGEQVTSAVLSLVENDNFTNLYIQPENKTVAKFRQYFEAAVNQFGRKGPDGRPFISASSWADYAASKPHESDQARRVYLSKAKKELIKAEYIEEVNGGYVALSLDVFEGAFLGLE